MSRGARLVALVAVLLIGPLAWALGTTSGLRTVMSLVGTLTRSAVVVDAVDGRLLGEIRVHGLRINAGRTEIAVADGTLDVALAPLLAGRVSARRLSLEGLAVRVAPPAGPSTPARGPLTVEAPFPIELVAARVRGFTLDIPRWHWTVPQAELGVRWAGARFDVASLSIVTAEAGALTLQGRFGIEADALVFEPLHVAMEQGGGLTVSGRYALDAAAPSELKAEWVDLRSPRADMLAWLRSPRGSATVQGPLESWRWTLDADALADETPVKILARGTGSPRGLRAETARLAALGGTTDLDGTLNWSPALAASLRARWAGLDPARRWPQWPGSLNGEGSAELHRSADGWLLAFDAGLRDSQLRNYPLALQTRGVRDGKRVKLERFELQSGASLLTASGRLLPDPDLAGSLKSGDLASLWVGLGGSADLSLGVHGSWDRPRFSVHGTGGALAWNGLGAEAVRIDADVAPAGASDIWISARQPHGAGPQMRADTLLLEASGTQARHRASLALRAGEARARLAVNGGRRGARWTGELDALELKPAAGEAWELEEPAALALARGELSLDPACLRNARSRVCAEFQTGGPGQHVAVRLRDFELGTLAAWMPPGSALAGTVNGTAALRLRNGELTQVAADLAASAGSLTVSGTTLEFEPASLTIAPDQDRLHARLALRPGGGRIDGEVWIAPGGALLDRPMLGNLDIDFPALDWLPVLSGEIASAHGSAVAALHVSGTLRGPSLDGRIEVRDGRVALTTPGIELSGLRAAFERGRDAPLKVDISAMSGGGRLTLAGELATIQPKAAGRFTLKGDSVLGYDTPDLRAWISPDLVLDLDGRAARLTGTVNVPRAEITPRRGERGGVGPSADTVLLADRPQRASGFTLESEVRVVLGEQVRFEGRGLKTRLTGAITAREQPGWPTTGHGELRLVEGRYKAYGQDLTIETGRLVFPGGPITDPAIDLSAYRDVNEDVRVGLRARGSLAKPEFGLYSTPAMSQEEQLSWLVLGRPLTTTLNPGQRSELNGAAVSLGLTGGGYIAQQLAPRLGLDEVSVESRPGETTDLARFTIGKYLSPRLFLSYGVGLFQPGQFVKLTYDLSRRFKLSGESGSTQGGDLLYSLER